MTEARLAAHIELSGLIRRVEALGGTGTVLAKGDREAGTILLVLAQRGEIKGIIERSLTAGGRYGRHFQSLEQIEGKQSFNDFLSLRRRIDPDLWIVELDIPEAERFAAQLTAEG